MGTTQVIADAPAVPLTAIGNPTTDYVTLTQHERIISEHQMQRLNEDDRLQLYTEEKFRECAISITTQQVAENIVPALQREVAHVIDKRTLSAKERAKTSICGIGRSKPRQKNNGRVAGPRGLPRRRMTI